MPSPSLSPRVQQFSAPAPSNDQAKTLFEQGLSQMAYNVLLSKLPNVAPDVVTFKILDTDPEAGNGVGSFVVARQGHTFYIPVVMAENQVKPLDLLFYKEMNVFLPLTKEWLEQLGKQQVGELGQGVKPPNTLSTDVDIRNTVVPPTTGRYSYAAEENAWAPFESAATPKEQPKLAFLDFLGKAPNRVKKAAAQLFETHTNLLKKAAQFYGKTALSSALAFHQEKVADYGSKIRNTGGALYIADKSTSAGEFKDIFGADAGIAYQGMLRKGYHAKDTRPEMKAAVQTQPFTTYTEPKDPGAYTIWTAEGKPVTAFVMGNPVDLTNPRANDVPARNIRFRNQAESPAAPHQGHGITYRMPGTDGTDGKTFANRYVGVTEDGKLINVTKLIGTAVTMADLEGKPVYKKTVGEASAAGPRAGQTGFFVMRKGHTFVGTRPVRIESVTSDSEGTKFVKVLGTKGLRTLAINKDHANGMLIVPREGVVHVPSNYTWLPTNGELTELDLMTSPKDVMRWGLQNITKTAAERVIVKKAYHGFTFGEKSTEGFEFIPALRKLATDSGISVEDAEQALKLADENGRFEFYALSKADQEKLAKLSKEVETPASGEVNLDSFHKLNPKSKPLGEKKKDPKEPAKHAAEDPMSKPKPKAEKKPEADPAQDAMAQVEAAQMAAQPQGPSPIDMAVAEQMANLQAQMGALTQMQQLMQTVQQRANQIAGSGGMQGNPAAAAAAMGGPMDPAAMGAGAAAPGMDPMAGAPPDPMAGGAPPPADPMGGGQGMAPPPGGAPGGQPGQSPTQGGMQPQGDPAAQGQDPNQPPPPPSAMMAADDGDVNSMAQQVNPQFMEQAGQLNDAGTFDAAALATMAQSPVLRDLVQAYLPNLEKSLDNIGRVLLTLWMDESHVKEDVGAETFVALEENLRTTFKGLGDLILKVNQNALVMRDKNESIFQG